MTTLYDLAVKMQAAFEKRTRLNGDEFWCLKDGSPDWMTDVVHEAHGSSFPDDTIYRFIDKALDAIVDNCDEDADVDDMNDVIREIEPDVYTHDLTEWLHESVDHVAYLTEALEAELDGDDGFALLQAAQKLQIDEVGEALATALENALEDFEDDDPEDDE